MKLYHKINSVFKRDEKNNFIMGEFAQPEFEYLKDNVWTWDEKVDGTNIRIGFNGKEVSFGGRTNNAQLPPHLLKHLQDKYTFNLLKEYFPDITPEHELTLHGEGYGHKIQKGGKYLGSEVGFVLFDVTISDWKLRRQDIEDIGTKLETRVTPIVGEGTIQEAIDFVRSGFKSTWGDFEAEGLVIRPKVELETRSSKRIITKIKGKDFKFLERL